MERPELTTDRSRAGSDNRADASGAKGFGVRLHTILFAALVLVSALPVIVLSLWT